MLRGEVWRINLDPTIGAEIRKTRPVIIVNDDDIGILPLKIIVPITDWKVRYDLAVWMTKIEPNNRNGLSKTSAADAFQIRSVSQDRFVQKLGKVSVEELAEITESLAVVLKF
jgi:mRNA interferase MazF